MPAVQPAAPDADLQQRQDNARRLRNDLQPALDRYAARCRARRYTGWTTGKIRYTD